MEDFFTLWLLLTDILFLNSIAGSKEVKKGGGREVFFTVGKPQVTEKSQDLVFFFSRTLVACDTQHVNS